MDMEQKETDLLARIEYLEESRRYILNALEMALSIGDFQSEIERSATPDEICKEAEKRLGRLMNFQTLAFYLVNQKNSDFTLACLTPDNARERVETEVDFMIEKGIIAWAFREKKGVIVPSKDHSNQILLHAIATHTRIRGMFVGVLNPEKGAVPDISMELLSVILRNAANALQNIELFETIQSERILKKSKEYIESILQSIPAGIMIIDADTHRIMEMNPVAEKLIGSSPDEVIGKECRHCFDLSLEKECPITEENAPIHHMEARLLTKEHGPIPILKTSVQTIVGGQRCIIESFVDFRSQKRAEELRAEHDKLKAASEISGAICHEMSQPLMIASGLAELLLTKAGMDEKIQESLGKIKKQVDRMGEITHKLQNINKYQTKPYLTGSILDLDRVTGK